MNVKKEVIERIRGRRDIVPQICDAMKVTRVTVNTWLNENKDDGLLTSYKVVQILSDTLKLTPDQILEGS